jgi:transcriptional regulator with XRE-family HTH domain
VQNIKDQKFLNELGFRVKELREAKGFTQLDLATLCDNHAEQIGRIERGQYNVTICSLLVIAKSLEVKLKDLLDFKY